MSRAAAATVTLLSGETVVASTTTDAQGRYLFSDLEAGRYQVSFGDLPPHRAFTARGVGIDPAADSDVDPKTGLSPVITLGPGSPNLAPAADADINDADFANLTVSAGLVGSYALGDTVWQDHNGNGVVDVGDGGVSGVTVELQDTDERVLASTTTSTTGRFTFDDLAAGSYQLRFGTPPTGLRFTSQRSGPNTAVDSDPDPTGLNAGDRARRRQSRGHDDRRRADHASELQCRAGAWRGLGDAGRHRAVQHGRCAGASAAVRADGGPQWGGVPGGGTAGPGSLSAASS